MLTKSLDNYFMRIGRLAIDVKKIKGVTRVYVADYTSPYRAVFDLSLQLLSVNTDDMSFSDYVHSVLQRNKELLLEKAGELK